jgi:hypothetical protein
MDNPQHIQFFEAERAGATLDGVHGAENCVDMVGGRGTPVHFQKAGFHVFQEFLALLKERGLEFTEISDGKLPKQN